MTDRSPRFGLLLFPNITQLDLTGPYEVLARVPGAEMHLLWKDTDPVRSDTGLRLLPTTALADCPDLDLLLVPGGAGVQDLLADDAVLDFLRSQARTVRRLVGVCTGALVLGAAGLLKGRRAATHWASRQFLADFGADAVDRRVVIDGKLVTGGGVTAGIDVALAVVAEWFGEERAKLIQLSIEYDPKPPFDAGSPAAAGAEVTALLLERMGPMLAARAAAVRAAAARLDAAER